MAAINPYLTFNGTCEEAFNFYRSVFGGDFTGGIMRFGNAPDSEFPRTESEANKVMHVTLPVGNTCIMGSDTTAAHGNVSGNNISVSINADSEEEANRLFNGLSSGGTVTMPMQKTFWGAYFGMFTDKFGIQWLINYDYNKQ
jgi:PhnB protein